MKWATIKYGGDRLVLAHGLITVNVNWASVSKNEEGYYEVRINNIVSSKHFHEVDSAKDYAIAMSKRLITQALTELGGQ